MFWISFRILIRKRKTKTKKVSESGSYTFLYLLNYPFFSVLIEGVLFRARYLGSTQLVCEGQPTKSTRMVQAEEAVSRIKALVGYHILSSVCAKLKKISIGLSILKKYRQYIDIDLVVVLSLYLFLNIDTEKVSIFRH